MPDRAPHILSARRTRCSAVRAGVAFGLGADRRKHRDAVGARAARCQAAAAGEGPLLVGCVQEAPLFSEVVEERDGGITFVNIRETAGWSKDAAAAAPKMAALIAAAAEEAPAVPFVRFDSEGVLLIYGRDEQAIEAGNPLKDHLDVTVLTAAGGRDAGAGHRIAGRARHDTLRQRPSRRLRAHGR